MKQEILSIKYGRGLIPSRFSINGLLEPTLGPAASGGDEPRAGGIGGGIFPPNPNFDDGRKDYCGNFLYENNVLKQILFDGGYITISGSTPTYHYYLKDHLGNNRVVVNQSGTVEQVNHYYPFGGLFGESTGGDVQRFKYNGKELERMHGLDWYDYGARHMDGARCVFTTMDPLCEKYYGVSPYVYCLDNPIKYIDPHGSDVHPTDNAAYSVILNTLSPDDRQYVILDKIGNIDYNAMKSHESESGNYKSLLSMVGSDLIFNISIQENYSYMDNQGSNIPDKLTYIGPQEELIDSEISYTSGLTTGESGKYGITLLPGRGNSGVNSPDVAAYIYIHPSLSQTGKAEALSHELYGHGYLYNEYRDRSISGHHVVNMTEQNQLLKQHVINARKETLSYLK